MCWDVAKPVTVLDILGMVGEDHGWGMRFQSSGRWQEARWSCCELPTWACGLAWECNNPSSKCKDGPHTFLWTNGSAVPVDILMNLVNPAHSLVVVFDQEWLASVYPFPIISTIIWFSGLGIIIDTNLVGNNADDIVIILPHNVSSVLCVTCIIKHHSWCLFHFVY